MSTLYLLNYNNYYNRIVKQENTLAEYLTDSSTGNSRVLHTLTNLNFKPNDGVSTTQVINTEYSTGDYVVISDDNVNITSRWFVLECRRNLKNQYYLTLYRDTIVDNYYNVIAAPTFIEKATLENSDPMIYNDENMTFNQIKTNEYTIRDQSNCAWVVGYIPSDATIPSVDFTSDEFPGDVNVEGIENWEYYNCTDLGSHEHSLTVPIEIFDRKYITYASNYGTSTVVAIGVVEGGSPYLDIGVDPKYGVSGVTSPTEPGLAIVPAIGLSAELTLFRSGSMSAYTNHASELDTTSKSYLGYSIVNALTIRNLDGKYIKDTITNNIYRIKTVPIDTEHNSWVSPNSNLGLLMQQYRQDWDGHNVVGIATQSQTFLLNYCAKEAYLKLELVSNVVTTPTSNPGDRARLTDAPYDMFCIPYSDSLSIVDGNNTYTANKALALQLGETFASKVGADNIYDVQLLPYCPVPGLLGVNSSGNPYIDVSNMTKTQIFGPNQQTVGFMLWPNVSSFTNTVYTVKDLSETTHNIGTVTAITDPKIQSQCDIYRLTSPNYNGQFEINIAKNNGIQSFDIDCTYKPYSPYIHVVPNFNNLYGSDFNDARGLICGGDFSLPQITSTWANYQLQNKNYQNSFDRQIENMNVNKKYGHIQDIVGAVTGAASAGIGTVAETGSAGLGVAAGVVSLGAGIADVGINQTLRNEAIDYTKDQFGYSLGNIQALPYGLSKVSAYNVNNKIFPILEYYTCTDIEKEALKNKILYNGMTVMRIGTIADFIKNYTTYIKGKVIRLEDLQDDYHMANTIASEINKGVFI